MNQKRNLLIYFTGKTTSDMGSEIQSIALALFVLDLTKSGLSLALITFAGIISALCTMPFAGVISDRWNRKKAMAILDIVHGGLIFIWAFLSLFNMLNMEILMIVVVLRGIVYGFFQASANAFILDIADRNSLRSVNSVAQTLTGISRIAGPVLGGILYGLTGITVVFFINALSFVISGISEFFIECKYQKKDGKLNFKKFFSDFKEGMIIIKGIAGLLPMFIFLSILNMIDVPINSVLLPFIGREVLLLSGIQYGFFTAVYIIGTMASGIFIATLLKKVKSKKIVHIGIIAAPAFQILLAFLIFPEVIAVFAGTITVFLLSLVILFMMGITDSMVNIPLLTNVQSIIPDHARGRVLSLLGILTAVFTPVGTMIYGLLLDSFPTHIILLVVSIITIILSIVFMYFIPWKSFEKKQA